MHQNRSKGLISVRASEKNKIKKSQESDISPICPEVPRERIFTKLGVNVPLVDIINSDKFCDNLFKGLNFTGGQIPNFPIGIWRRRYNSAALPRSLWYSITSVAFLRYTYTSTRSYLNFFIRMGSSPFRGAHILSSYNVACTSVIQVNCNYNCNWNWKTESVNTLEKWLTEKCLK